MQSYTQIRFETMHAFLLWLPFISCT